jgi:hypothetical protein
MNADDVVTLLTAEGSALRREGAELVVAFALDRRVGDIVDPESVVSVIVDSLCETVLTRAHERHVEPAWARHLARATASDERLRDHIPDDARAELDSVLRDFRAPTAQWTQGLVDPKLLRELVAPVLQRTLLTFARKLPLVGLGASDDSRLGGLAERLAKRAEKLADAGRRAMGGVGAEIDARLQKTAKEFSRDALEVLRDAMRERLASEEGKALATELRLHALDHLLDAPVAELMRDADAAGRARLAAVLPRIVAFDAARPEMRAALREEVDAWLGAEADRTLGDLLDDAGVRRRVTELAVERVDAQIRELLGADPARDWIGRVLEAAASAGR